MTTSARNDILTPEHWRELVEDSAILPEVLTEEDIKSLPSSLGLPTPHEALRHPNTHKGEHFGKWGEEDKYRRPIDLGPGLWFGTRDVHGRSAGQYKPNRARTSWLGRSVKYETCRGTRPSFAIPRCCLDALVKSMCDVFFTEGYKKALALASAGACAISLAGVDSWLVKPDPNNPASEPVEDFDAVTWRGRLVWIVYDSDAVTKMGVQYAEKRLTKELESRGAIVMVIRIPHASDGSKRGIDDYLRDRLAAGVSREDALAWLKAFAIAELQDRARRRAASTPTGSDGEETCQSCATMAERSLASEARLDLIRRGPVPTAEALGIDHLISVSINARSRGESVVSLYVPAEAKSANIGTNSMSRALGQVRRWQEDPETASALHFRIDDVWENGKQHVKLRVLPIPNQDGAGWKKADEYKAVSRLPRDPERGQHGNNGGKKIECPKHPEAPISRTRIFRCTEDDCTWVQQDTAIIGGSHQDGAGEVGSVSEIHGSPFVTTVTGTDDRHQDGASKTYSYSHQDGAGSPPSKQSPVSFVSPDEAELAAGPHYQGDAPLTASPPEEIPWYSPRWRPPTARVAGGEE